MADTHDYPVPPANFQFLVESILMQAQMQLGLLNFGELDDKGNKPEPNLMLARHSIDLLGALQEKTRGNLTVEEQRLLDNGITELRFRYVQVFEEVKRKQASSVESAEPKIEGTKEDDGPRIITADGGKGSKTE